MRPIGTGILVVLFMTWRYHWIVFGILLVPVLSLVFSAMYLRYHYVIDVIAGVGLAGISMDLSDRLERAYCGFLDRLESP